MFSCKTTTLLGWERKAIIAKKKVCIIKHSWDTRYSNDNVISHDGMISNSKYIYNVDKLSKIDNDILVNKFDVVLIDEGQFFVDLIEYCDKWTSMNISIVISALSGDYKKEPFEVISRMISKVDTIIPLKSICTICGDDASFTKRLVYSSEQTLVGGNKEYEPRCNNCFNK